MVRCGLDKIDPPKFKKMKEKKEQLISKLIK